MDIKSLIRDIPDFPTPGIMFRDITPVLAHPQGLSEITNGLVNLTQDLHIDYVVGIESRGFILGAPIAYKLQAGFIPVRKPKKLPAPVYQAEYALEYGTDRLEMHQDAFGNGSRVLIVDDVIATGGTASATAKLVELGGGIVVGFAFLIELSFLSGRLALPANIPIFSLVSY
ncbi:adenine phosphoribosyltransferase [Synechococcus sp. PCC 7502]|uniref:adenine phosphoribosyltransferase n=1 Tax=Synechococcus sp. PCC 7502 TaxID=1173263 RepID=UPI00029FC628|nr:adenine phosphoribosyltransferase [Synechococcus sp. PCC 7502]AFY72525.1 adenine phosphoribosyltransferase [Synechococcus sp. PCC 7502]